MDYFIIKNGVIANKVTLVNIQDFSPWEKDGAILVPITEETKHSDIGWEWNNGPVKPTEPERVYTSADVNRERDRRTHYGFMFQGKLYQFDPDSRSRITGAATLAKFAIVAGIQPGNLRWINPAVDFSWIAADNSLTLMDAHTCSAFGDAAAVHEQRHIFAARAIKAMDPIPADYATNNAYWPA
jgi:hypothetical protein